MEAVNAILDKIDGVVWGWGLIILILGTGIYLTVRTGFVQVRHLGKALKWMVKNEEGGKGEVTSFAALCTALSATIGTGNIVGVATAICAGGPGALFWMLVAAFFGMATKYAEGFLAIKYRTIDAEGHALGGPFYYIEKGLGKQYRKVKSWKWLGKMFAFFGALAGLLGIGTITQINGIASAANILIKDSDVLFTLGEKDITVAVAVTGAAVTILAALVIIGGIKRISSVSEVVVPFMAVAYVLLVLVVLICNASKIPGAVKLVVTSAFNVRPVMGAIAGIALKTAIQKGIGRGIFSNEAGLGSAPIAAAAAKTKDPVRQGLVTMTGTFIDTIIICTMTGLSIVTSGAWDPRTTGEALEGFDVTAYAWRTSLPWSEELSVAILALCLAFFAFTTIIGWDYYSERCMEYLIGGHKKGPLMAFKILYILAVAAGPYLTVSMVWTSASIFNALMALPNLVALLLLGKSIGKETRTYFKKLNKHKKKKHAKAA